MPPTSDIYTGDPIVTDSDEHVLLNALGGRLSSKGLIDKATNDELGLTIDASLARFLAPIRSLLDTRSGTGEPPPKLRGVQGADGKRYHLNPGAKTELGQPSIKFTEMQDGSLRIEGNVRDRAELKRLIRRRVLAKDPNADLDAIVAGAQQASVPPPTLNLQMEFGPLDMRCIAKMACNLFAIENGDAFRTAHFDQIRTYVRQDNSELAQPVGLVSPDIDIGWSAEGYSTLDHVVGFDVDGGTVEALVILYGHYQFRVFLGSAQTSYSRQRRTYRVNPILQVDRHDEDFGLIDELKKRPFRSLGELKAQPLARATIALMSHLKGDMSNDFTQELLRNLMERYWPDGSILSEEHANAIAREASVAFVSYCRVHGIPLRVPQEAMP